MDLPTPSTLPPRVINPDHGLDCYYSHNPNHNLKPHPKFETALGLLGGGWGLSPGRRRERMCPGAGWRHRVDQGVQAAADSPECVPSVGRTEGGRGERAPCREQNGVPCLLCGTGIVDILPDTLPASPSSSPWLGPPSGVSP